VRNGSNWLPRFMAWGILMRSTTLFLSLMVLLGLCTPASAQPVQPGADFQFVLSGMRKERLKVRSGLCRMTGQYAVRNPADPKSDIEGPLTILDAFEGEKVRFDRAQPGWVVDRETVRPDPSGQPGRATSDMKRGIERYKFCDNGKKSAFWSEDQPQINVMASLGDKPNHFLALGYFDARGLGLYEYGSLSRQKRLNALFDEYASRKVPLEVDRSDPAIWVLRQDHHDQIMDVRVSISVDVRNGFTPFKYLIRQRNHKLNEEWYTVQERTTKWEKRNDVWLPVSHNYVFSPGKDDWRNEVSFTISWEKVNEPIDPDLFDYKSFGAPDWVGVVDNSLGYGVTIKPMSPPPPAPSRWRTVAPIALGVIAVGAIIVGALTLIKRRRRRALAGLAGSAAPR
jgi:hypothetical protein